MVEGLDDALHVLLEPHEVIYEGVLVQSAAHGHRRAVVVTVEGLAAPASIGDEVAGAEGQVVLAEGDSVLGHVIAAREFRGPADTSSATTSYQSRDPSAAPRRPCRAAERRHRL